MIFRSVELIQIRDESISGSPQVCAYTKLPLSNSNVHVIRTTTDLTLEHSRDNLHAGSRTGQVGTYTAVFFMGNTPTPTTSFSKDDLTLGQMRDNHHASMNLHEPSSRTGQADRYTAVFFMGNAPRSTTSFAQKTLVTRLRAMDNVADLFQYISCNPSHGWGVINTWETRRGPRSTRALAP